MFELNAKTREHSCPAFITITYKFSARTLYDKLSLKSTDFSLQRDGDKVIIDTIGYKCFRFIMFDL